MATKVVVPDLGEGIDKVEIVSWLVREGQDVSQDQDIVEMVTDKAVFRLSAPSGGVLARINAAAGYEVPVGTVIAEIT